MNNKAEFMNFSFNRLMPFFVLDLITIMLRTKPLNATMALYSFYNKSTHQPERFAARVGKVECIEMEEEKF